MKPWIKELKAECSYHLYGSCLTVACCRTNGCAIAHALYELENKRRLDETAAERIIKAFLEHYPLPYQPNSRNHLRDCINAELQHDPR